MYVNSYEYENIEILRPCQGPFFQRFQGNYMFCHMHQTSVYPRMLNEMLSLHGRKLSLL